MTASTAPANAFTCDLEVRWSDQDLNGHVNNARVLTLAEEARVRADTAWSGTGSAGVGGRVVRNLEVEFARALHYGRPVRATVWVGRIGRTSYTICHELSQQGQLCVYAECVMVNLDAETGRPAELDADARQVLTRQQAS
ncbi:acyl-CoA thioesterase [Citricoccus muralis]|uniref:Thioesterase family protein n=1 Tax=Citricoccus muralis TaxID=169134 RepID=A0ABY8H6X4_9MICC|nr:thioesterase family protein [Citricoccus muralis]WFP16435.1 thioesterase family protein [Citricoccus muralis]